MSGDNDVALAAAQKEVEDLKAELQTAKDDTAKKDKMIADAQDQINKQGNELGDYRKNIDTALERIDELEKKLDGKAPETKTPEGGSSGTKTAEELEKAEKEKAQAEAQAEVDRLSTLVTEEDDAALNEAYDKVSPEFQMQIDNDPVCRKKFLETYLGERAVPKRSWGAKSKSDDHGESTLENELEAAFDKTQRKKHFVPPGSGGATTPLKGDFRKKENKPRFSGSNAQKIFGTQHSSLDGIEQVPLSHRV